MVSASGSSASPRASLSSSSALLRSSVFRRRLPIIGAICVLSTLSFSNLFPSLSSPFKTIRAQSLSSVPLLRSKEQSRGIHSTGMEAASTTVPSIVVYVTVPNKEAGIESVYEWKGEIQTDSEELLIIKTRESLLGALTEHVKANHEYEVPEVIAMPITGGNAQYLEWLKNSTRD
ncbi:hypothetical protein Cgig2_029838 [Carnegiea gigantea]|uniref:Protein CutA, chloroplastic n=1 Tax=Carnegiea gigantea TaxID=171969 RepID=A0A9Q1GWV2_9CARY|nr:hypothetical protein Cgig2_029838 [Carnegiea gigantea]